MPLTKEYFDTVSWQDTIEDVAEKNCERYSTVFSQLIHQAREDNDTKKEEAFALLTGICSMRFTPDEDQVFQPLSVLYETFSLDHLSDEHIAILAEIAPTVSDAELRARLADIVWVKGRNKYYSVVEVAVNAYVESARWMLNSNTNLAILADYRFRRAAALARSINNKALIENVFTEITQLMLSHDATDENFPFALLLRSLLEYSYPDIQSLCDLSEKLAELSESKNNWMYAQAYWMIKADCANRMDDEESERTSRISAAEALVKFGEIYAGSQPPNYGAACFQLQMAIEILRKVGGMRDRCEELHSHIRKYRKLSLDNFQTHSIPIGDASDVAYQVQNSVKGKPLFEVIISLATKISVTDKQSTRAKVEEYLSTPSFHSIFPMMMLDYDGNPIASSPTLLNADEDQKEQITRDRMFWEASQIHQKFTAEFLILPIVRQLLLDHFFQMRDLLFLVEDNAFIPPDRAEIYLNGLYAGFQGDYLTACHLLIPQIENSLRYVLMQYGENPYSLDPKTGVTQVWYLETLLNHSKLQEILGEDVIFDLECLLIRKFGLNLRNHLAHGLIPSAYFKSYAGIYCWWLVLHLCCIGLIPLNDNS